MVLLELQCLIRILMQMFLSGLLIRLLMLKLKITFKGETEA